MKLLKKLWGWIRRDGLLHGESCALLLLVFALFMPYGWAAAATVAIAILVELWQKKHKGVASWHDVICDLGGVLLGTIIYYATFYSELMFYD